MSGASGGMSLLPAYLVEKHQKVREYRDTTYSALEHNMEVSVRKTKGFTAHLRQCIDLVEGSVLALGIPTAYEVVSRLEEVRGGLDLIHSTWKSLAASRREENRLHDELFEASCGSYSTMREKNDFLERELKTINMDRDRKDAALDNAIQYVHSVIEERSAWQEQHGYNRQELGVEELSFSDRCTAALSALYTARRAQKDEEDTAIVSEDTQKIPIGRPYISLSDNGSTLFSRWSCIENTRQSAVSKSCRLKYIPPEEEVSLLREVLAMGTGSRVLMKDVWEERKKLQEQKDQVRHECERLLGATKVMRQELTLMKWFLRETMEKRAPFASSQAEVCRLLTDHIDTQAMSLAKQWFAEKEKERRIERLKNAVLNNPEHGAAAAAGGGGAKNGKGAIPEGSGTTAPAAPPPIFPALKRERRRREERVVVDEAVLQEEPSLPQVSHSISPISGRSPTKVITFPQHDFSVSSSGNNIMGKEPSGGGSGGSGGWGASGGSGVNSGGGGAGVGGLIPTPRGLESGSDTIEPHKK